jgi:hypothetical protein
MSSRSPQEKKALSYARDGRNTYGENDKSSRKNIPLRKRLVNRANRHSTQQKLSSGTGEVDLDLAEVVEERALGKRPKAWSKVPDIPLRDWVQRQSSRRAPKK